jgi:hypothetical protein
MAMAIPPKSGVPVRGFITTGMADPRIPGSLGRESGGPGVGVSFRCRICGTPLEPELPGRTGELGHVSERLKGVVGGQESRRGTLPSRRCDDGSRQAFAGGPVCSTSRRPGPPGFGGHALSRWK